MKRITILAHLLVSLFSWGQIYGFQKEVDSKILGKISLKSDSADDNWDFGIRVNQTADSMEEISISVQARNANVPPEFSVSAVIPQKDMYYLWDVFNEDRNQIGPDWGRYKHTHLAVGLPVYCVHNGSNDNRLTVACSEVIRDVNTKIGLREEGSNILIEIVYFKTPEAPLQSYKTKILLDARDRFWSDCISDGVAWMTREAGITPLSPPEDAFAPLYSTWYQFHQNVSDSEIEKECRLAAELGMKNLIVDDGWQTDDNNRGYAFCGDWHVSKNRFSDFADHVRKVKESGMNYMLWYSLPLIGNKSRNYARFKDKFLYEDRDKGILDPRFPEVREFLIGTFENALSEYGLDGFKLDFIDRFNIASDDPAIKENYAGRDIKALPEAVNVLMSEIYTRLSVIKPDILIEFRQSYMGPAIRQYGNILRAGDCPGDARGNRQRISTLRLTSGETAVHGDMLEWNNLETPENAAKAILSSMFGVVQYSLMLSELPEDHLKMVRHWFGFLEDHRETLLKSDFRPNHPEAGYPLIEAASDKERIFAVYLDNFPVTVSESSRPTFVVNSTGKGIVYVDSEEKTARQADIFNTFGEKTGEVSVTHGINKLDIPVSGYAMIK